jgi:hypothetical protein
MSFNDAFLFVMRCDPAGFTTGGGDNGGLSMHEMLEVPCETVDWLLKEGDAHGMGGSTPVQEKQRMASCCWEFSTTNSPHRLTRWACRCQSVGKSKQVSKIASM